MLPAQTMGWTLAVAGGTGRAPAGGNASGSDSQKEKFPHMAYVGSVADNVVYVRAQIVFADVGATARGLTSVATLGRHEPGVAIGDASVEGNSLMTPSIVEGKTPVYFLGARA